MANKQRAVLVYQAGIANVFKVDTFSEQPTKRGDCRLLQSDFHTAAAFARGMQAAGAMVRTACCNEAGDIANRVWNCRYDDAPFSDKFTLVGGVLDS